MFYSSSTSAPASDKSTIATPHGSAMSTASSLQPVHAWEVPGLTGCPGNNGTQYPSRYGGRNFTRLCNLQPSKDYKDVAKTNAGIFDFCMDQCALWNAAYVPVSVCRLVVFVPSAAQPDNDNCYLKDSIVSTKIPLSLNTSVVTGIILLD